MKRIDQLDQQSGTSERTSLLLDVVSDTICPWCFVGKRRLDAAIEEFEKSGHAVSVIWRPFELNPQMPAEGMDRKAYRSAKFGSWEKSRSLDAGVIQASEDTSIAWNYDAMKRTPNTFASHCLVRAAFEDGGAILQDIAIEKLFSAYFSKGRDVGSLKILSELAGEIGLNKDPFSGDFMATPIARIVKRELAIGAKAEITGVPSVLAGRYLLFNGAQPVETVVQALKMAAERPDHTGPSASIYL